MENTHTTTTGVLAQAIASFPEAKFVVLVDQVRAMTAEQMVQTAAAYSYAFHGADVINNCRESYIRQGYGTIDEFYHRLMELRDGKI
jgi:signal recognition particle GTPase